MTSWMESAPVEGLGPGEVHVWRFPLGGPDHSSALRRVLSGYTRTPPQDIEFSRGVHGKPTLAPQATTVEFNVSHSGDWGLIAVARVAVGVDVEQIRPTRIASGFEQRFLTAGERDLLRQRTESHGESAFFLVWSRKEAYLKAAGFGLSAPFSRVDSSRERLPDLDEHGNQLAGETPWSVQDFFVDDRHAAAVVARSAQFSPTLLTLRRPDL